MTGLVLDVVLTFFIGLAMLVLALGGAFALLIAFRSRVAIVLLAFGGGALALMLGAMARRSWQLYIQ